MTLNAATHCASLTSISASQHQDEHVAAILTKIGQPADMLTWAREFASIPTPLGS